MSYKSKFKYNEAYSNEDIAEALSIITGSGIVPSTPNEILSKYASGGVTYADEQLNVSLSGTAVTVGCGVAIWSDGSYIIVYEPETFTISLSGTYYVYLKYNTVGDISVNCETTLPSSNRLLLATVTNGVVNDNRTYATSKINGYGGRAVTKTFSYEVERVSSSSTSPNKKTWTFNLSNINFEYIIVSVAISNTSSTKGNLRGYYKKSSGQCYGIYDDSYGWDAAFGDDYIGNYDTNAGTYIKLSYANGTLTINTDSNKVTGTFSATLDIL